MIPTTGRTGTADGTGNGCGPTYVGPVDVAGLCLYPDRYSYRYETPSGEVRLDPSTGPSAVELPCAPITPTSPTACPWWLGGRYRPEPDRRARHRPGRLARDARLAGAPGPAATHPCGAELVASDPPRLVRGDLLETLPDLVAEAPHDATIVVLHSAVLVYLDRTRRERFVDLVRDLDVTWLSNEGAGVLPSVAGKLTVEPGGRFVLARDGVPVALTGPHGQSYEHLPR
ncbi:hypothetical protein GCM10023169_09890 [Georgenia halophila]|uniref:CheR-type methyltransferase domain-containing protein n=1 Tax=Georgenia halophila TaxID=620889 RepID=A0ABP8KZP6_9MICO